MFLLVTRWPYYQGHADVDEHQHLDDRNKGKASYITLI
jgi:hypothetical protein